MEIYSKATQFFKDKKYEDAKNSFLESLRLEQLSDDQIKKTIKNLKQIGEKSKEDNLELQIVKELYEKEKYLFASSLIENINFENVYPKVDMIFLCLQTLESLGEIDKLKSKIDFFAKYLFENKRLNILSNVSSFLKDKIFLKDEKDNIEFLEALLNDSVEQYIVRNLADLDLIKKIYNNFEFDRTVPSDSMLLLKSILEINKNKPKLDIYEKKKLLNFIYRNLITREEDSLLELLFKYAIFSKNKKLCLAISESRLKISDEDSFTISKFIDDTEEETKIDFASELFDENIEFDHVKKLIRDIKFLMTQGQNVDEKVRTLKNVDPDNSFFLEYDDNKLTNSMYIQKSETVSSIEMNLLTELAKYSTDYNQSEEPLGNVIRSYKKYIHLMNFNELLSSYKDLIVVFNQLNASAVSEKICEKVEKIILKKELKEIINYFYLKSETLKISKKMFLSLNVIDEVLENYPLNNEEKICFLYMKAEIYRELNNKTESMKFYVIVKKMNKNYRLVNQRLKEID